MQRGVLQRTRENQRELGSIPVSATFYICPLTSLSLNFLICKPYLLQRVVLRVKQQTDVKHLAQYLGLSKCLIQFMADDNDDDDDDSVKRCGVISDIEGWEGTEISANWNCSEDSPLGPNGMDMGGEEREDHLAWGHQELIQSSVYLKARDMSGEPQVR